MADRERYIEVLSNTVKAVKEFNEDTPIKISLECVEDIIELLKEQQQVVRCKDCIWFHKPVSEKKLCKCNYHGFVTNEDKYCWWGEKDA